MRKQRLRETFCKTQTPRSLETIGKARMIKTGRTLLDAHGVAAQRIPGIHDLQTRLPRLVAAAAAPPAVLQRIRAEADFSHAFGQFAHVPGVAVAGELGVEIDVAQDPELATRELLELHVLFFSAHDLRPADVAVDVFLDRGVQAVAAEAASVG